MLFLFLQCSCLAKTGRLSGELIGLGIDSVFPVSFSVAKKDRECRFADKAAVMKPFEFKEFLADAGFIMGVFGDLWLAFVYPAQNPKTVPLQAGYVYSLAVLLLFRDPSNDLHSPYKRKNGWGENRSSPCTNLSDFYYKKYNKYSTGEDCVKKRKEYMREFYRDLTWSVYNKSEHSEAEIETVKEAVGHPVLLDEHYYFWEDTCHAEYYIEFKGGKEALRKAVQKQQKK